jgi:hypothetical protein
MLECLIYGLAGLGGGLLLAGVGAVVYQWCRQAVGKRFTAKGAKKSAKVLEKRERV